MRRQTNKFRHGDFQDLLLIVPRVIGDPIWVPSNPRGAKRLLPEIIEAETDLYLRRLWGQPSEELLTREIGEAEILEDQSSMAVKVLETLSTEELAKLGEPTKAKINTLNKLSKADGFFFGFPITFGNMVAQVKAFIDATGDLGKVEQLADKPTGIFITTRCQGGGKETMWKRKAKVHMVQEVIVEGVTNRSKLEDAFQRGVCIAVITKIIKQAAAA
ncbi:hypothetical protein JHK82_016412 [Glycine max]|nr:hypothetical protein JHK82_016412 [Glycine max]